MKKSRYVCVKMSPIGHKWSAKLKNWCWFVIFFLFRNFTKKVVSKFLFPLFFSISKSISTKQTLLGFPPLLISYSFGFIKNHVPLNENEPKVGGLHSKNKNDKGLWTPYLSRERCGRKSSCIYYILFLGLLVARVWIQSKDATYRTRRNSSCCCLLVSIFFEYMCVFVCLSSSQI